MQVRNKGKKSWTRYAGLLAGLALIAYLFSKVDLAGSMKLISSLGPSVLLILLPYLGLHLLETAAWQRLFPKESGAPPFFGLFKIQLVTETVSMTLPAGVAVGEPLRPWLCRKFLGIPLPDGFATVAVRKLLLGATQGIYTLLGAVAGFGMLQAVSKQVVDFQGLGVIMIAVSLAMAVVFTLFLILMTNGNAVGKLHRLLLKIPFEKVRQWLLRVQEGFAETDRQLQRVKSDGMKSFLPVMVIYVAAWMMLALETYLILQVLGLKVTFLQVLAFDTALTILRAIFFFIPSGLGIQDLGYLAFFHALGLPDYLAYGGAFVMLRRLKEVLWYSIGYGVMFMEGIHLRDAQQVSDESA
ncbi:flippase-like domain-containing protein [Chlorobaculum thiosulfatiphilum]|uniref:Flippase-like domain-containing protein n=1 Tax=Chlorobaculum thiosulfatiphilum TaxID=115852 RepID=A0A5C4S7Z6_CHLTI|nr:lysylphosphatidylglycerol synthase transmembrane domain-containing protein [Chlorobaculum thiosulfatiphilum]TNJ39362.1 flippase-like domain-containing protein [Chlorobaculum thiosulfatiphilum]